MAEGRGTRSGSRAGAEPESGRPETPPKASRDDEVVAQPPQRAIQRSVGIAGLGRCRFDQA
jgi:hypothetical protein